MVQRSTSALRRGGGSIPLYGQVLAILRQRIVDGTYAPGDKIEPEDRLAEEFGVSRATIRQAVGELVRQGLADRQQGRGTFVLQPEDHAYVHRLSGSLANFMAEKTRTTSISTTIDRQVPISARIADKLQLDPPIATVVRRVRAVQDRPFTYTINYLPNEYGDLIDEAGLESTGLMWMLQAKGVEISTAEQVIRAEQVDIELRERLDLEFAAAVLFLERLVFSTDGRPVQFARTWYRADMYEFRVTLRHGGEQPGDPYSSTDT